MFFLALVGCGTNESTATSSENTTGGNHAISTTNSTLSGSSTEKVGNGASGNTTPNTSSAQNANTGVNSAKSVTSNMTESNVTTGNTNSTVTRSSQPSQLVKSFSIKGVGIGSTKKVVLKTFGPPSYQHSTNESLFIQYPNALSFTVNSSTNQVIKYQVDAPNVSLDNGLHNGMSIIDVKKVLSSIPYHISYVDNFANLTATVDSMKLSLGFAPNNKGTQFLINIGVSQS